MTKGMRKKVDGRGHCTVLPRSLLAEPAWRALPTIAQALYPWLKLEWHGARYNNNGKLRLSVRQAAERMGVGINTAARAFQELQAKGFAVVTERACLGIEGMARAPSFELTEIPLPHSDRAEGRKLYRHWRPGHDFLVVKHATNNPEGRNGQRRNPSSKSGRTCRQSGDVRPVPVTKSRTARRRNSDVRHVPEPSNVIDMKTSLFTRYKGTATPDLSLEAAVRLCPLVMANGT